MDRAAYVRKIHSENTIELLTKRQNELAKNYRANRSLDQIIKDMRDYSFKYEVTNAAAIYDFDYPVTNENLKQLEQKGYLKTIEKSPEWK
jgi:tRNA G26 N,N-dimethylase Trm1